MVTLLSSARFLQHDTGNHVENVDRLRHILAALSASGLADRVTWAEPTEAADADLEAVHPGAYRARVEAACEASEHLDPDTPTCPASASVARLAAGAAVDAARLALGGDPAFALCRPPGHHATPARPMGFCLYNNVAVAAKWARREGGARRVAVFDFDVHHGNGTQDAFYARDDVLFVSIHQSPLYPGTGLLEERGHGVGEGYTVNLPVPAGMGDSEYLQLVDDVVLPVLAQYAPDLLLVSAGFDAHHRDPLGGLTLTAGGFQAVVTRLRERHPRLALALEGGYDPVGLSASCVASVAALAGVPFDSDDEGPTRGPGADAFRSSPWRRAHAGHWDL